MQYFIFHAFVYYSMKQEQKTLKTQNNTVKLSNGEKFNTISFFIVRNLNIPKVFINLKGTYYYLLSNEKVA